MFSFLFALISCSILLFRADFCYALGDVTLTSSGFSDMDSEDVHQASQWVVRNSSGTIFDSGEDTINLTSITISSSYFSNGVTYWWKVRYQDQHNIWSDYSDETSFVYTSGGAEPTVTSTASTTVTSTPTATATTTTTTTATSTITTTPSPEYTSTIVDWTPTPATTITSTGTVLPLTPPIDVSPTQTTSPNSPDFKVEEGIELTVTNPSAGDKWYVGRSYKTKWKVNYGVNTQSLSSVDIFLSTDGGKSFGYQIASKANNDLFYWTRIINEYVSEHAVIRVIGYSEIGEAIASDDSDEFIIQSAGGIIPIIIGTTPLEQTNTVVFLGSLVSAIAPMFLTVLSSIPVFSRLIAKLISSFAWLLRLLPWRKKPTKWGVTYDSVSKKPIANVALRIYSEPDGRMRALEYSKQDGTFGFLVPTGKYSVTASMADYRFPSLIVTTPTDDVYENIYRGEVFDVKNDFAETKQGQENKNTVKISIPMDGTDSSIVDVSITKLVKFIETFIAYIRYPIMVLGTIMTIYLCLEYRLIIDYILLLAYIVIWTLDIIGLIKPKTYGTVSDENNKPVDMAMIRIIDETGKIKGTVISGSDGKFSIALQKGHYAFDVSKVGYTHFRTKVIKISKPSDLGRINIKLRKISRLRENVS